ncbi:hypothetical protein [Mycobacterium marinum]|uniref:hypothetical protein n=1 Tax=Mycobacterium marinum TaxID=1781 RepID=UPI00356815A4
MHEFLDIAQAPWHGICRGACDRELGWPTMELVARHAGGWCCIPCATELVRERILAELRGCAS